jgi:cysteine desulfuration protein SufE
MGKIEAAQAEILENLAFLEEWDDKYQYIIDIGENLPGFQEECRIEDNLVKGCQSKF